MADSMMCLRRPFTAESSAVFERMQQTMIVSPCEVFNCNSCTHRTKRACPGCAEGNLEMIAQGEKPCAIYECVTSKGLTSCSECTSAVCSFPKDIELVCPVRARFEKMRNYQSKLAVHYEARLDSRDGGDSGDGETKVSDKIISRLRWYLVALDGFAAQTIKRVSSQDIARKTGVKSWLVRRDLSHFGAFGRKSIGYDTDFLRARLREILRLGEPKKVVWIGAARLADDRSLIGRFAAHNCEIVAVFDADLARIGAEIGHLTVVPQSDLLEMPLKLGATAAVIAVPEESAQAAADALITAGIRVMLNLTSAVLVVPADVVVRGVDVVAELFALSYYCGETSAPLE